MYSEQLAILLLIAANGLSGNPPTTPGVVAKTPQGNSEQISVSLKLDPRLNSHRNPYTRKIAQRRAGAQSDLLARAD